jgi:hypothetical protein
VHKAQFGKVERDTARSLASATTIVSPAARFASGEQSCQRRRAEAWPLRPLIGGQRAADLQQQPLRTGEEHASADQHHPPEGAGAFG